VSGIWISYDEDSNAFIINCPYKQNYLIQGLPDRKYSKRSKRWIVPALRRNIEKLKELMLIPYVEWKIKDNAKERLQHVSKIKGEDARLWLMPVWYPWKNKPRDFQAKTLDKAVSLDFYALLFDQGLGKTYTAIQLATVWRMTDQIDAVVVLCLSANLSVWEEQIPEHGPLPAKLHTLAPGKAATKRFEKFCEEKHDFPWLIAGIEAMSSGSGFDKTLHYIKNHKVCIIVDESSTIKNHKSARTDRIDYMARLPSGCKRLILSGTSLTEGVENWYSQYHFLEPDVVGYNNFYSFRNQYCITIDIPLDPENPEGRKRTKIVSYKNMPELAQAISFCTSRYEKEDVLDLPPKVHQTRILQPTPAQKKAMQELEDDGHTLIEGEDILCDRAITVLLRMQQITGGFYPVADPDDVRMAAPLPGRNPKMEDCMHWLGELSGKGLIWCNFRIEQAAICAQLDKLGIGYVSFIGGMPPDERKDSVILFQNNPDITVFCCTYAAAYGLTLTAGMDNYVYSQTFSADKAIQFEDRTHRIGTIGTVTYTTPLLEGSPDKRIQTAVKRKRHNAANAYDMLEE